MTQMPHRGNWRFAQSRPRVPKIRNGFVEMTYSPFTLHHPERPSRIVVTCDHATNIVPPEVAGGYLGLPPEDMARHIAYDIGCAGVTRALADALDAPAILSNFSRLVIDPNRGEDDPTILMRVYDGTIIPANRTADEAERERRMNLCYRPYHNALGDLLEARQDAVVISVHSFTEQLRGRPPRPWHVGILSAYDKRLSTPFLARLAQEKDLCIGDNEPYSGHLNGDAIDRHALQKGRLNALIELRQDLISREEDQIYWGRRLAPLVAASVKDVEGHR